jgi:hypothetical protein
LNTDAPVPGTPLAECSASETLRFTSAHSASNSAASLAIRRRVSESAQRPFPRASPAISASRRRAHTTSETNPVPRSKAKVTIAIRQPSPSAPTRFATGTRTSSSSISENSSEPPAVVSGRRVIPGASIGMISHVMPRCRGPAVGPVRTSSSQKSATWACEVQILRPLTT